MRSIVVAAVACLSIVGLSAASDVRASIKKSVSIPAQGLAPALQVLAKQRDIHFVFISEDVNKLRTDGAEGELTVDEALSQLLIGTGLTFQYIDEQTVSIVPITTAAAPGTGATLDTRRGNTTSGSGRASAWQTMRLARANQAANGGEQAASAAESKTAANDEPASDQEVIVTAQKREERLIDVPLSVSVLSAETLRRSGATQFRDWANSVPGLSYETTGAGRQQVSLRGLAMVYNLSPMVGIYLDEVPYGSTSPTSYGYWLAFDSTLTDLDRIEVLKGPQGTLYGASSMGGLIKYVTPKPSTESLFGKVQTGLSSTQEGGTGYSGSASINLPLVRDKLALSLSGFYTHDGGYIDNRTLGRKDINRANVTGGRADMYYMPTEKLNLRVSAFMQDVDRDGEGVADFTRAGVPLTDDLEQRRFVNEPFQQKFRVVNVTMNYDFSWATLTSSTGYQTADTEFVGDVTGLYAPLLRNLLGRNIGTIASGSTGPTDKFTQEVRLTSSSGKVFDWVVGAFHTNEITSSSGYFDVRDPAGNALPNDLFLYRAPSRLRETAGFGTLTWHATDRLDLAAGLRHATNRQRLDQYSSGLLLGSAGVHAASTGDATTYLANARFKFNDHATAYLRYATGYRPGGPNFVVSDAAGNPRNPDSFDADTLKSYELGFKGETADRRLGIDMAVFSMDWSDMIIINTQSVPGLTYRDNAESGATSRGVELSLSARPVPGLDLGGAFTYMDSKMSEADRNFGAAKGERLPTIPRVTANLKADYQFSGARWQPSVGMSVYHVSERTTGFLASAFYPRYTLPEYTTVELRAGMTLGAVDTQLYVRNLFDEVGQMSALSLATPKVAIIQPRTIGVMATIRF